MANKEKGTNWFVKFILKSLGQEKCDELMFFATDVIDRDFTEFTSVTEIEEVLTSRVHEFMASGTLTEEELFYLKFYTGYEFKNINNTMRNTWNYEENGLLTEEKKQHYHKMGDIITRAVRKFPSLSMNIKTYRGVSLRAFREYGITSIEDLIHLEGNYLYEAGFSSTSLLKNTSYFNKDLDYRDNCNIEIEYSIPAESQDGFPLLRDDLSYSKSQLEYLINSGSLSRVHKVEVNPTTNTAKLSVVLIPKSLWDPLELEQEKQQTFIPS